MLFLDTVRRILRGGDAADPDGWKGPVTTAPRRRPVPGFAHPAERKAYVQKRLRELQGFHDE
jgi:hypothetical protein